MNALLEMVGRKRIFGEGSAILGVAVTFVGRGDLEGIREPLGVVVETGEYGLWVRRFHDPADVAVLYPMGDLEIATQADLASVARTFLGWQYQEVLSLRRSVPSGSLT